LIAEWDQQPAGYAVYFDYYSTWAGPGLYLEDVFVQPQFRGKGIGMALLAKLAKIAIAEKRCAMRWKFSIGTRMPLSSTNLCAQNFVTNGGRFYLLERLCSGSPKKHHE